MINYFENMDQVSFNLPTTNIFVLNGQAVFFQNGTMDSQNVNGDVLPEDIFNKDNTPKITTEIDRLQENTYEGGGFVIVKGAQKENNSNLIQLTVQEAAELGIQLSVDNTPKNNVIEVQNTKNQNLFFQKVDNTLINKINESSSINFATNDTMSDVSKIPCASKSLNQYTLLPQYLNGQIAYAVQLSTPDQVHTTQNVGIPISVPTMETQSVTSSENKFVSPMAVKTVVNKTPEVSNCSTSHQTFVPNPRIRILSKVKQDIKKSNQRKFIPINKDKYIINRQRKLAPQKMLLPPLTKSTKEISDNKLIQQNLMELSDSRNHSINSNEQESELNQSLLKSPVKDKKVNEINGCENNIKESLSNLSSVKGNHSTSANVGKVQVLTIPQGSQLPKKIISYKMPNDNKTGRKLTPSELMQIASALQKNRLNRQSGIPNSSTLFDLETNTRIICRVLYPEDLASKEEKVPVVANSKKRGRPLKKEPEPEKLEKVEKGADRVPARTRSGRVTRPPRHFFEDYKRLKGDEYDDSYSDYHSGTDENIENSPSVNLLPGLNVHQKRKFSSQFRCPTCNKVYLGRVRMALHFNKYPDHCDNKQLELLKESASVHEDFESSTSERGKSTWKKRLISTKGKGKSQRKMLGRLPLDKVLDSYSEKEVMHTCGRRVASMLSTWEMLLLRLENKEHQGKCKVQAFLDELESFVKSVRAVSQQILRPPNCEQSNIHVTDDTLISLLGIGKGWYSSNDCGLPQPFGPVKEQNSTEQYELRNNDEDFTATIITERTHTLKDEQDVVKVKEELSELDLLCVQDDPIGVDSVDQIVSERLKTMAPVDDFVSTLPAMPATSTDELVRGFLTDDLINSLETFIPPTHPPPDLDFTVLSNEFNTPR
ncbi:hypothetical protein O3M35_000474 [Rhynocoris fuscipes]|uniref:DUF4764 domain-containing protein n=1 Tax=Rhynocoris fuscipes TaxID=488301 RepID=A0AAW1DNW4_9HEMI